MTTADVAAKLNCNPSTVGRWCVRLGIAKQGRDYILTPDQVRQIAKHVRPGPGNPTLDTTDGAREMARQRKR